MCSRAPSSVREPGRGATRAASSSAVQREQEEEERARQPLARAVVLAVVPEPHERAVEAPAEEQLGDGFDAAEERRGCRSRRGRQVPDVDAQQQEIDDLDGDVAERRRSPGSSRARGSSGTSAAQALAEREQVQEAPARHRQQPRQPAVQRQRARAGCRRIEPREHRHGREDAAARDQREAGAPRQLRGTRRPDDRRDA